MESITTITVYALAWGGKFIGQGQDGIAYLTVTDEKGTTIVEKKAITQGGTDDGSGNTAAIMGPRTSVWGTPIDNSEAYSYQFNFYPVSPVTLTFKVEVYHYGKLVATAVNQHAVWPDLTLSGDTAVVVVVPGLLTSVVHLQTPMIFFEGANNNISANVYMMCGCKIDNVYWPGDNFNVYIVITDDKDNLLDSVPLKWTEIATFSGNWTPKTKGNCFLQSFAIETTNGNTAFSPKIPGVIR